MKQRKHQQTLQDQNRMKLQIFFISAPQMKICISSFKLSSFEFQNCFCRAVSSTFEKFWISKNWEVETISHKLMRFHAFSTTIMDLTRPTGDPSSFSNGNRKKRRTLHMLALILARLPPSLHGFRCPRRNPPISILSSSIFDFQIFRFLIHCFASTLVDLRATFAATVSSFGQNKRVRKWLGFGLGLLQIHRSAWLDQITQKNPLPFFLWWLNFLNAIFSTASKTRLL